MGLISRVSSRTYRLEMSSEHPFAALGDLSKFKVPELKDVLKQLGLASSGKKQDLIDRIQESIDSFQGVSSGGDHETSKESVENNQNNENVAKTAPEEDNQ